MSVQFDTRQRMACNPLPQQRRIALSRFFYTPATGSVAANDTLTYDDLLGIDELVIVGVTEDNTVINMPYQSALLQLFQKQRLDSVLCFQLVNPGEEPAALVPLYGSIALNLSTLITPATVSSAAVVQLDQSLLIPADSAGVLCLRIMSLDPPDLEMTFQLTGTTGITRVTAQLAAPVAGQLATNAEEGFAEIAALRSQVTQILRGLNAPFVPAALTVRAAAVVVTNNTTAGPISIYWIATGPTPGVTALGSIAIAATVNLAATAYFQSGYLTAFITADVTAAAAAGIPIDPRLGTRTVMNFNGWAGTATTLNDVFFISTVPPGLGTQLQLPAVLPQVDADIRHAAIALSQDGGYTLQQARGMNLGHVLTPPGAGTVASVTLLTGDSATVVTFPADIVAPRVQTNNATLSYGLSIVDAV